MTERPTESIERATTAVGHMDDHPMLLAEELDREDVRQVVVTAGRALLDVETMARAIYHQQVGSTLAAGTTWETEPDETWKDACRSDAMAARVAILGNQMGHTT